MKHIILVGTLLLIGITGEAFATGCSASSGYTRVLGSPADPGNELRQLLRGTTVCWKNGNDWEWQEFHHAGGALIDYKKGPTDPVDPTTQVGTWRVVGGARDSQVEYDYVGGQPYSYKVWQNANNGTYDFCGLTNVIGATLQAGKGPC